MQSPKSILVTGASSGIGAGLALAYAAPDAKLYLSGRNGDRLAEIADRCRAQGATVATEVLDVTDSAAMADWINRCDGTLPLDLVIANAGVSGGSDGVPGGADGTRRIFAVNIDGVVNTVLPALDRMAGRGRGQVAIVSSVAAFRGLPGAPAYCASKAAVKSWGEGLRVRYARQGLEISVICPGFVESRMTADNPFRMPFLMDADRAASIISRRLARNRGRIGFPFPTYAMGWLLGVLPSGLVDRLTRGLPEKEHPLSD
ncbi:MAG: SDR family NAD(P)-dependent oxidoreductase [Rhodospirillaceae bacterium]|jgi:NADP-dependent 3-hydroxy acid dehydrogenase YdfG|nr:SDR family NAD(P)-dependent oxidoreductase [Rhodospirillaceae bacterium]